MNREEAFKKIIEDLPGFKSIWEEHLEYWGDDEPGITNDFSELTEYAYSQMQKNIEKEIVIVANLIEEFIKSGDEDVNYGTTIGFLEGLTNRVLSEEPVGWKIFVDNAGEETKDFLKKLDKSWGTKTPKI